VTENPQGVVGCVKKPSSVEQTIGTDFVLEDKHGNRYCIALSPPQMAQEKISEPEDQAVDDQEGSNYEEMEPVLEDSRQESAKYDSIQP
jgi:hypothetical protein